MHFLFTERYEEKAKARETAIKPPVDPFFTWASKNGGQCEAEKCRRR